MIDCQRKFDNTSILDKRYEDLASVGEVDVFFRDRTRRFVYFLVEKGDKNCRPNHFLLTYLVIYSRVKIFVTDHYLSSLVTDATSNKIKRLFLFYLRIF